MQKTKYKMQNAKWQPEHNGNCQPEPVHRMSRSYTAGLRRLMGRRPSSDWSSVRIPHLSTIGAIRKERYMIISCKFFFFYWQLTNHNSFGHIFFPSSFHCLLINWIFSQHLKYLLILGHDYHLIQLLVCICVCAHIHLPGLQRGCRKKDFLISEWVVEIFAS